MSRYSEISWTNKSVLDFAEADDPVEKTISKTRELVFKAKEEGWSGPPFNPIEIAKMLGIKIEANSSLKDARLICLEGKPVIQFNPMQPRERVRFSIAHEVAHFLFPDWKSKDRHRGGSQDTIDEWQLEMLCNISASELVLPIGSIKPEEAKTLSIEDLMIRRREFDVSAEAFLIRTVNVSTDPLGLFIASVKEGKSERRYVIDYFVGSPAASLLRPQKKQIPDSSIVYQCNAIGHTDKAIEDWFNSHPNMIECVGLSPYPNNIYPRVAGLVRFDRTEHNPKGIIRRHGDILSPKGDGKKLICQLVNDRATKWGGGVAKKIATKFPEAEKDFEAAISEIPPEERLGWVVFTKVNDEIIIASLIGQHGFGPSSKARIRYLSLQKCFESIATKAQNIGASIHMPRIGTGAAGGDWHTIKEIIDEKIIRSGLSVTLYELPPKREQMELF